MDISPAIKQSVALVVVKEDDPSKVLLVLRLRDDAEFPGLWGLPAASLQAAETLENVARRIGKQKLGVEVKVAYCMAAGRQDRSGYTLEMSLYKATLCGALPALPDPNEGPGDVSLYMRWKWGHPVELADSARRGSLCSRLLLESLDPS